MRKLKKWLRIYNLENELKKLKYEWENLKNEYKK